MIDSVARSEAVADARADRDPPLRRRLPRGRGPQYTLLCTAQAFMDGRVEPTRMCTMQHDPRRKLGRGMGSPCSNV